MATETKTEIADFWSAFFIRFLIGAPIGPVILTAMTERTEYEYLIHSTLVAGAVALFTGLLTWFVVPGRHRSMPVAAMSRAAVAAVIAVPAAAVLVGKGVLLVAAVVGVLLLALAAIIVVLVAAFFAPAFFVFLVLVGGGLVGFLALCDAWKASAETKERRHRELVEAVRGKSD